MIERESLILIKIGDNVNDNRLIVKQIYELHNCLVTVRAQPICDQH